MQVTPIGQDFVAEVAGLDLRRPLTAGQVAAVDAAVDRFAVLVFATRTWTMTSRWPSAPPSARWSRNRRRSMRRSAGCAMRR
jgi:alpha-ketoglutarate-dependent taurine dioxygenase